MIKNIPLGMKIFIAVLCNMFLFIVEKNVKSNFMPRNYLLHLNIYPQQ